MTLENLHAAKRFKRMRASSYDPTGGNSDAVHVQGGGHHSLPLAGPGIIRHIWMTLRGESVDVYREVELVVRFDGSSAMRLLIAILLVVTAASQAFGDLAAERERMKNRSRRIIYNNDGCDVLAPGAHTPEGFLAQRMRAVPGSQVDSVFYCTGATVMFSHDAKMGEVYGRHPSPPDWAMSVRENIVGLRKAGRDPLGLVIEFCRKHDLEVFFTHRINDIHDSTSSGEFELAQWKIDNPRFYLSPREDQSKYRHNDPRYWWSALDFEHPEVRDYLIAIVDDVCRRYDIDGYEIDYFRSPMFFKPNLDYEPATPEQIEILTGFQQRVREVAEKHGRRRGRPILVSTRVPMTVERCRHVGIDIERWLAEDLLDVLTTGGGYVPFTMPTRELVELGHRHGKPVYPTISASGLRRQPKTTAVWRGAAANAWDAGADGIVLFNTFPGSPGHAHFNELGDKVALRRMDKIFAIDNRRQREGDLEQGIMQEQIIPVELKAGATGRAVLPVADDMATVEAGEFDELTLRVRYEGVDPNVVDARLNGTPLTEIDESTLPADVRRGRAGSAYAFGRGSILDAGRGRTLQLEDRDFSFSLWVRTTQVQKWSGFVVFVERPDQQPGVKLYWNAGRPHISLRGPDLQLDWEMGGGETLADGSWHHYAVTFDRDGEAIGYLDGRVIGRRDIREVKGSLGTDKTLLLGAGDIFAPFEGFLDDVQLHGRVLTEAEVVGLAKGKTPPEDRLLARWQFDETKGRTHEDSSGHGHHARPWVEGEGWMVYRPDPKSLRQGNNELTFTAPRDGRVVNVELHVKYQR